MKFDITTEPTKEDVQDILNGLIQFNLSKIKKKVTKTELACFSYKENGEKSGGIVGKVMANWLEIKYLWVDETLTKQGIGSELLTRMERAAIDLGCEFSLVDTFSFQARPFYEKNGYVCQLTLDNYLVTHERHYLVKKLDNSFE